ncbi:aldehyde dehydrogenase family protein [Nocardioides sp. NPDC051685]|uniref:aldehyde dehydrogenase family protein n=1 Tax=Nocardioides sp. NPDC051685 TaxID=3364334 RepID=UPI003793D66D
MTISTAPSTMRPSGHVLQDPPAPELDDQEPVTTTVARLRSAFATGRTRDFAWRERQLRAMLAMLENEEAAIAAALGEDLDRFPGAAWSADIATTRIEVRDALKNFRKWARRERHLLPLSTWPSRGFIEREPLGTVLVIGAWNFPFYLTLGPLVGALAAGNAVVVKPSELAPASSRTIKDLVAKYLDTDAVAVVEGGVEVTQELLAQGFDHCLFTGSPQTGKKIMEAAAATLTPVTLELGGKSPAIVTASANLDVAARRIIWSKLANSGQTCITTDYVIVERSVQKEFLEKLLATVEAFTEERPDGQPVINRRQFGRLTGLLSADHGGRIIAGGGADDQRCLIDFTVVLDPAHESPLMSEEIFGPILPVITVDSLDDAIASVKRGPKPLAAYLFSNSRSDHERVVRDVSAGGVVINHALLHCMSPQLPFGGVGNSGMGSYHGKWGFDTFSHLKSVVRAWARPDIPLLYPPHTEAKARIVRKVL